MSQTAHTGAHTGCVKEDEYENNVCDDDNDDDNEVIAALAALCRLLSRLSPSRVGGSGVVLLLLLLALLVAVVVVVVSRISTFAHNAFALRQIFIFDGNNLQHECGCLRSLLLMLLLLLLLMTVTSVCVCDTTGCAHVRLAISAICNMSTRFLYSTKKRKKSKTNKYIIYMYVRRREQAMNEECRDVDFLPLTTKRGQNTFFVLLLLSRQANVTSVSKPRHHHHQLAENKENERELRKRRRR